MGRKQMNNIISLLKELDSTADISYFCLSTRMTGPLVIPDLFNASQSSITTFSPGANCVDAVSHLLSLTLADVKHDDR